MLIKFWPTLQLFECLALEDDKKGKTFKNPQWIGAEYVPKQTFSSGFTSAGWYIIRFAHPSQGFHRDATLVPLECKIITRCLLAHYLVCAGPLVLLIGLRPVAHGGFRGPGAPTGDGLWLVSICNAMTKFNRGAVVNVSS